MFIMFNILWYVYPSLFDLFTSFYLDVSLLLT